MGPSGLLLGPTGRKIGGGGVVDAIPTEGDLKALWDYEAKTKLFSGRFFQSTLLDGVAPFGAGVNHTGSRFSVPGSFGGVDGNVDLQTDANGEGVNAFNLYSTPGGSIGSHLRPTLLGGFPGSWSLWPNTYAHYAFMVRFQWDPTHTTGTDGKWEALEHGIGDLYRDGWFVGLHGYWVEGQRSSTGQLKQGGPYISLTCGWSHWSAPGRAIHSSVPIVNGQWHRVQFGRNASKSYLKVDDEPFIEEPTSDEFVAMGYQAGILCEAYPSTSTTREAYVHGKGGSSHQSIACMPLNSWWRSFYRAVGA